MLWREDELETLGSGALDERLLPSMNSLNAGDVNTGLTDSGPRLSWTTRPSNGDNPDAQEQKTPLRLVPVIGKKLQKMSRDQERQGSTAVFALEL